MRWKRTHEEEPPNDVEVLTKCPEGIIRLANWRAAYEIFTCQGKRESAALWQWADLNEIEPPTEEEP